MANLIFLLTILMEDKVWYHISFADLWEPLGILGKKSECLLRFKWRGAGRVVRGGRTLFLVSWYLPSATSESEYWPRGILWFILVPSFSANEECVMCCLLFKVRILNRCQVGTGKTWCKVFRCRWYAFTTIENRFIIFFFFTFSITVAHPPWYSWRLGPDGEVYGASNL